MFLLISYRQHIMSSGAMLLCMKTQFTHKSHIWDRMDPFPTENLWKQKTNSSLWSVTSLCGSDRTAGLDFYRYRRKIKTFSERFDGLTCHRNAVSAWLATDNNGWLLKWSTTCCMSKSLSALFSFYVACLLFFFLVLDTLNNTAGRILKKKHNKSTFKWHKFWKVAVKWK